MSPRKTLSSVDTAWYRLDTDRDPADIIGVLIFDGELDEARLRSVIEERLLCFDRFRQCVDDSGLGRPQWVDDPQFHLDHHFERRHLEQGTDRAALQQLVGEVMSEQLDPARPLWRIILVDNLDGKSALIAQLHHCLGDGFALAHLLLRLADTKPAASAGEQKAPGSTRGADGRSAAGRAADFSRMMGRSVAAAGRLITLSREHPTRLKRSPVGRRRAAWSTGLDLARIKHVAHAADGTVNDVLMAAMTGAWRRYLIDCGEPVDSFDIRAIVPVNLRPITRIEEMPDELGNRFGLVFLDLPISCQSANERLVRVQASMRALKKSPQAYLLYQVLNAAGHIPRWAEQGVANMFGKRASTVVTNLPGPREPLWLAGRRLTDLMFWAPHPARLGTNTSIISYAGRVRVGVRGDTNVLSDPKAVVAYFDEEFELLADQLG